MKRLFVWLPCLFLLAGCTANPPETTTETTTVPATTVCIHADADDNGSCDGCGENLLIELDFFALNDLHGKFQDTESQPGVDELTTYLKNQPEHTVLLSSGDMWQGSYESNLTNGNLMTDWMNELGFVSMTLGNHEFDWGEEAIMGNEALAQFPLLAINVYDRETGALAEYCQSSVLVEREGVTIGIIGAVGDVYSSIASDKTEGIYFRTGDELTALVKAEATRLREQGADIIVYSLHDGYAGNVPNNAVLPAEKLSYYDASLSEGYVDIVFEAHIHKQYVFRDEHGVYHLQGGGENKGITHAEMMFNSVTGSVNVTEAEFVPSTVYETYPADEGVEDLLEKYADEIALGSEVLGINSLTMTKDELRQLVAELYYQLGMEQWGDEYNIVLGGGFISVRNPWSLAAGEVEYGDLQALLPFDNQIVLCAVKGNSLRYNFFETNNENYFIHYEEYGNQLRGQIDPRQTYYIVTDTYCSGYAPNELTVVEEYDENVFARDLLADYIQAGNLDASAADGGYQLTGISELLELCSRLQPGETSQERYYVQGRITAITNDTYGDLFIADEKGNELYVYGIYDSTGSLKFGEMYPRPRVGDTVVLCGQLQRYVSGSGTETLELYRARLIEG